MLLFSFPDYLIEILFSYIYMKSSDNFLGGRDLDLSVASRVRRFFILYLDAYPLIF